MLSNMPTLYDKVSTLSGMGAVGVKALAKVGVKTVRELLNYFPYRYEDYSKVKKISELIPGETVSLEVELVSIEARRSRKSKIMVTEAIVKDDTDELTVKWFNQPFLVKSFKTGTKLSLAGIVDKRDDLVLVNPRYEKISESNSETTHTGRIVPIYPRSGSVGEKRLRSAMKESLVATDRLVDVLPESVREDESFPSLSDAIKTIHFPDTMQELERAVERLKFDELFLHQLLFAEVRKDRKQQIAYQIPVNESELKSFSSSLSFELTPAQKVSAWDIVQDLSKEHPMNRMLEGDVGSGKTVVAAMAINSVLRAGKQVVYLAPTEILANQQAQALGELLQKTQVALLTRSSTQVGGEDSSRLELQHKLKTESVVVVATHAILEDEWKFNKLALVVVDEQHRFGVRQRHELLSHYEIAPHLLSMSATPIPRSLSLTVYGDLDLSIIDQMPKGRMSIGTKIVSDSEEGGMYEFVKGELKAGNRVYIVCPLIDPSDKLGAASVSDTAQRLKATHLRDCNVAELHGRMKGEDKDKIMQNFKDGSTPILISTTVVEVGVDVPEATIMIIEGAERFGLAQLHQLRGRVGRSDKQSYCFLRPSDSLQGKSRERLEALVNNQNGFELAELDLEFRGPGNMFGNEQSGFPDFKLATLSDVLIMKKARDYSSQLLEEDPDLEDHPLLRDHILAKAEDLHLE